MVGKKSPLVLLCNITFPETMNTAQLLIVNLLILRLVTSHNTSQNDKCFLTFLNVYCLSCDVLLKRM